MRIAAFGGIAFLLSASANAHICQIHNFDRTAPAKLRGEVEDQYAKFVWAADVDVEFGQSWACNCIENFDTKGWSGRWVKGKLSVPVYSPLAPSKALCRGIPLGKHRNEPDYDAPIIYATTNEEQPAAVYVRESDGNSQREWSLELFSTYLNAEGVAVDVSLEISIIEKDPGRFEFSLTPSDAISVGLSYLPAALSPAQLVEFAETANASGGQALVSTPAVWAGSKLIQEMAPYLDPDEPLLIIDRPLSTTIAGSQLTNNPGAYARVALFNSERRLILTTSFDLPMLR